MFVARRLWKLAGKKGTPSYLCYIDVTKAYDPVDRTLLWAVLARFGARPRMRAVINQFHDGMQVRVQLDYGGCLEKFDVGHSLWQGCVLAPLLFNVFFTAVLRVAENRFLADAAIMENAVQLQRKKERAKKKGKRRAGKTNGRREEKEEEVQ